MDLVIMAGGMGKRFWPASRRSRPKQYFPILGDKPMIEETWRRISPMHPGATILVVNDAHLELTREIFKKVKVENGAELKILGEPQGRNTAPCIGLAAVYLATIGHDDPMVILPADHYIADLDGFRSVLGSAIEACEDGIATIGITPTRPETGFGYIRKGAQAGKFMDHPGYLVDGFVEKPDPETARGYLTGRRYLWNAGIFVARPTVVLEQIEKHLPQLHQGLVEVGKTIGTKEYPATLAAVYERISAISFDYGIMEHTDVTVRVIPGDFGWDDVGNWQAVYELCRNQRDGEGNLVVTGKGSTAILTGCGDTYVRAEGKRAVAVVGGKGLLVVDTPDALLVADSKQAQQVREVVEELERRGLESLL